MTIATPDWVKDAVFYQIFPDRFAKSARLTKPANIQPWDARPTRHNFLGGDLLGIVEKLDYLVDLGVNAIYLNPIFASASNHRYHTHDFYQIDPLLGGQPAFQELIRAAHARNLRVIIDGVFNHASRGFFQFNHLLECGAESPYADWFHVERWPVNAYNEYVRPNYWAWWGLHALPKLNTNNPQVREFLWGVGAYWLEQGVDGWRLDVPSEIDDDAFWQEFRRRCRAVNPEAYIVGELWHEAGRWLQGDQFDGQMNYLFTRAAFSFFLGEQMDQSDSAQTGYGLIQPRNGRQFLAELERLCNELYHPEIVQAQMLMLGSHDTPRLMTVAQGDKTAVRLMFLCQMTLPGAPNIYYGDEIGMWGHGEPDSRRAFPWHNEKSWNVSLRAEVKRYIQLRQHTPALRRGSFRPLLAADKVAVYQRQYENQTAIVAFNLGEQSVRLQIPWPADAPARLRDGLQAQGEEISAESILTLPGRSGAVWVG